MRRVARSEGGVAPAPEFKAHPEIGKAGGLRRAMLALMQDKSNSRNAHPAIRAPFIMVGEGGAEMK